MDRVQGAVITQAAVARLLGVSVPTVRKYERLGKLRRLPLPGRKYARAEVEAMLAAPHAAAN